MDFVEILKYGLGIEDLETWILQAKAAEDPRHRFFDRIWK